PLAACSNPDREHGASLVIYGPVWTGDETAPTATAVAIRGDTIVAVGDSAEIATWVSTGTEVISTTGMVVPGFGDGHVHLLDGGLQRSEEHTSELQSRENLVCRLLLEKKK